MLAGGAGAPEGREKSRRLETASTLRQRLFAQAQRLAEEALAGEAYTGSDPEVAASSGARESVERLRERGLIPLGYSIETAQAAGSLEEPAAPTFVRRIAALARPLVEEPKTWYGKLAQQTAQGALGGFVAGSAGTFVLPEAVQQFRAWAKPPSGRTIRDPTVLSTAFDVLETPQRALLSKWTRGKGESPWTGLGQALLPPSWVRGATPRDATTLYRRLVREQGGNPDSWGHVLGSIGASIVTDPLTYTGIGAVRKAFAVIAAEQAGRIAQMTLRKAGVARSAARTRTAAVVTDVLDAIHAAGNVEAARPAVTQTLFGVSPEASATFGSLGDAWGRVGLRVGLPILQERVPWAQVELVSAATLGRARRATGRLVRASTPDELHTVLGIAAKAVDPKAEFRSDDALREFYDRATLIRDIPEHEQRTLVQQIRTVLRHLTAGPAKLEEDNPLLMDLAGLRTYVENPKRAAGAQRRLAVTVLDAPWAAAFRRREEGLLDVAGLVPKGVDARKLQRAVETAYAKTVLQPGPKPVDTWIDETQKALGQAGVEEAQAAGLLGELASRAGSATAIASDADNYARLWDGLTDQLRAALKYHKETMRGFVKAERAIFQKHAVAEARRAADAARREASAGGATPADAQKAAAKAGGAAYKAIMDRAPREIDSYVAHFIRNKEMIRHEWPNRPFGFSMHPEKEREFLSLLENYEHGQNPADDLAVTLAARAYAHVQFQNKVRITEHVLGDRRWAVPAKESGGLTVQVGWDPDGFTHPITGAKYTIRREVGKYLERAIGFTEPGNLEKALGVVYDSPLGLWKAYITHGRLGFYNIRNMLDDSFRMWMGGHDFNPMTWEQATLMTGLGRLEARAAVKGAERAVRGKGGAARQRLDALEDWYDGWLRQAAQKRIARGGGAADVTWGEVHEAATQRGILEKGYAAVDLGAELPADVGRAKRWDPRSAEWSDFRPDKVGGAIFGQGGVYLRFTGGVARRMENIRRMTLFLDRVKRGDSYDDAAKVVKEWLFDYKDLTEVERQGFRRLVPFYTFLRRSVPAHIHGMLRHPGRYAALEKTRRGLEEKAESEYGPIGAVREYMDDLWAWRLPAQTVEGSDLFLSTGLSVSDINVLGGVVGGGIAEAEMGDRMTPVVDLFKIIKSARDPRTGLSIRGEYAEPDPVLLAVVKSYNATAGLVSGMRVPVKERRTPTGLAFPVIPARLVMAWEKSLPNVVQWERLISPKRGDPFEEEQRSLRRKREALGVSVIVNNPIRAETQAIRTEIEGGLAGVAAKPAEVQEKVVR